MKEYNAAYYQKNKARLLAKQKVHNATPQVKAKRKEYNASPHGKARKKEHNASPQQKARRKEYQEKYRAASQARILAAPWMLPLSRLLSYFFCLRSVYVVVILAHATCALFLSGVVPWLPERSTGWPT